MQNIALVTGSTKELGYSFAEYLARKGFVVVLHYFHDTVAAQRSITKIKKLSPKSTAVNGNLTKKGTCEKIINKVMRKYGRLDLLINNVGNFVVKPVEEWSEGEFNDIIQSNLNSVFFMMQESFKVMKKGSLIVNIGCVGADKITIRENTTPYYIAKFGVVSLTKHFASLGRQKGIRVNVLMPGCLETSVVIPKGVSKHQIVPLSDMVQALAQLLKSKKSGELVDVSKGWRP